MLSICCCKLYACSLSCSCVNLRSTTVRDYATVLDICIASCPRLYKERVLLPVNRSFRGYLEKSHRYPFKLMA